MASRSCLLFIPSLHCSSFLSETVSSWSGDYNGLVEGGALILSEKVLAKNAKIQDMLAFTYYDFKREAFSASEILDKEKSIRDQMHLWSEYKLFNAPICGLQVEQYAAILEKSSVHWHSCDEVRQISVTKPSLMKGNEMNSIPRARPGTAAGKRRYDLYANAYRQIKKAYDGRFYIECIALLESIMADRLEARRAKINPYDPEKQRFAVLGILTQRLDQEDPDENIMPLYERILQWSVKRNVASHQMVKLGSKTFRKKWSNRYRDLKITVDEGMVLARDISDAVKRLNRPSRRPRRQPKSTNAIGVSEDQFRCLKNNFPKQSRNPIFRELWI